MILSRGVQNRCELKLRRCACVKTFLQFSVSTFLVIVTSSYNAHAQVSYSASSPLFPISKADNGELLGGPLNKVIVDINGDGYDDAIYQLFTQGQLRTAGGVPSPIVILLNDRNGGFYDGTLKIIAGTAPKALWVKNFIAEDFNRDGRLDFFACNK